MSDILFITPNIHGNVRETPVGTLLLATILRQAGMAADILEFFHFFKEEKYEESLNDAIRMVKEKQPKIVSFYTRCDTYHVVLDLAKRLKQEIPALWIVFGGPQSDITAEETVCELPYVDFVCCGEGETTIVPFFTSLLKNEPDFSIDGLVYQKDGQVIKNPRPQLLPNLDQLPEIDYSLVKNHNSALYTKVAGLFPVDVGRGCPFGCTYCSTKTFWGRKYRLKSPERIVEEIKHIHEQFGISEFAFEHDMFTLKRDQVMRTCELLKTLDFPVVWRCSARMDCLDRELVDVMADAGLESIFVGIETGSARMQKLINKNLKLNGINEMLTYIRQKGIKVTASFIYGFPEETEEDVAQTLSMIASIEKLVGMEVQTHLCTFLPGTELSERYLSDMQPVQGYSDIIGAVALEDCKELIEAHPALFHHFLEYRTPLRTKLQHFSTFIKMWEFVRPVYQHLSDHYEEDQLMQMYYDFVSDNEEVLERTKRASTAERITALMKEDRFIERFAHDPQYDMIRDIYRFKNAVLSQQLQPGQSMTDLYCLLPTKLRNYSSLRECEKGLFFVTISKNEKGALSYQVKKRVK